MANVSACRTPRLPGAKRSAGNRGKPDIQLAVSQRSARGTGADITRAKGDVGWPVVVAAFRSEDGALPGTEGNGAAPASPGDVADHAVRVATIEDGGRGDRPPALAAWQAVAQPQRWRGGTGHIRRGVTGHIGRASARRRLTAARIDVCV